MTHRVTLIPGDGTGPELTESTARVLEATGVEFDWDVQPAGAEVMADHGGNQILDLYAQVRPCKTYPGVRTRYRDVDLVVVRETTEDIYAGIEFEQGTPDAEELIAWLEQHGNRLPQRDSGISIKPISISGTGGCSNSPSITRGGWGGARSRPSTRRTS
jgi:isocitrate dehydrogenase (NAD+)